MRVEIGSTWDIYELSRCCCQTGKPGLRMDGLPCEPKLKKSRICLSLMRGHSSVVEYNKEARATCSGLGGGREL